MFASGWRLHPIAKTLLVAGFHSPGDVKAQRNQPNCQVPATWKDTCPWCDEVGTHEHIFWQCLRDPEAPNRPPRPICELQARLGWAAPGTKEEKQYCDSVLSWQCRCVEEVWHQRYGKTPMRDKDRELRNRAQQKRRLEVEQQQSEGDSSGSESDCFRGGKAQSYDDNNDYDDYDNGNAATEPGSRAAKRRRSPAAEQPSGEAAFRCVRCVVAAFRCVQWWHSDACGIQMRGGSIQMRLLHSDAWWQHSDAYSGGIQMRAMRGGSIQMRTVVAFRCVQQPSGPGAQQRSRAAQRRRSPATVRRRSPAAERRSGAEQPSGAGAQWRSGADQRRRSPAAERRRSSAALEPSGGAAQRLSSPAAERSRNPEAEQPSGAGAQRRSSPAAERNSPVAQEPNSGAEQPAAQRQRSPEAEESGPEAESGRDKEGAEKRRNSSTTRREGEGERPYRKV